MNVPLRLALADDQALVRRGLIALLSGIDGLSVVLEADNGEDLLGRLAGSKVDVILSDIRMPVCDGFTLVQRLREAGNKIPVLLLTTFDEPDLALRAAECGAQGFLLKDASPEDGRAAGWARAGGSV